MISIIDYKMGNTRSVFNAFKLLGENVEITNEKDRLTQAEAIVLPGVGSFNDGMKDLNQNGLKEFLTEEIIDRKKPYLGICLGLEFLAKRSYEGGICDGFGWIDSEIVKLQPSEKQNKVPHMGWNDTEIVKEHGLMKDFTEAVFYYLHSFHMKINNSEKEVITSKCNYGGIGIVSSIQKNNIYAVQFHPEKSQENGLKLLKNFLEDIRK